MAVVAVKVNPLLMMLENLVVLVVAVKVVMALITEVQVILHHHLHHKDSQVVVVLMVYHHILLVAAVVVLVVLVERHMIHQHLLQNRWCWWCWFTNRHRIKHGKILCWWWRRWNKPTITWCCGTRWETVVVVLVELLIVLMLKMEHLPRVVVEEEIVKYPPRTWWFRYCRCSLSNWSTSRNRKSNWRFHQFL